MSIANEKELLSAVMTAIPPVRNVLVIAPHPDDEVFGCGGTLSLLHDSGSVVTVIIVTDGAQGGVSADGNLIEIRAEESRAAARILGLDAPTFWGLPDRGVDYGEVLIERLIETILETAPDWVFLPSPTEWHPDHQAIAFAGAEAVRRLGGTRQAAFYEVSAPLPSPNLIHDISSVEDIKRQAMRCFHSQLLEQPYDTRISGINHFRALHLGANVKSAEAFTLLAATDLGKGLPILLDGPLAHRRSLGFATTGGDIPLVSVIIRSMDRPTLSDALDSIAIQTYSNIEVVLVNAKGSEHKKIDPWCGRFPLHFIDSDKPLRRSRAANTGLDAAHGDYLIFLDDDDWFESDHIQHLADAIRQHPEFKVVYTGSQCVDEWKNPLTNKFDTPFDAVRIVAGNFIPIHAALFSRDMLEFGCRLDESLDVYEDWDFWIQLSRHGDFLRIDGLSAVYRITQQSGFGVNADPVVADCAALVLYKKWFNRLGDRPILGLMHAVTSSFIKGSQISSLHQAVAERDGQIGNLNQAVTERDGQITILSQSVVESDRAIAERDRAIAEFDQAMAERDRQVAGLNQAIADHDGQIAGLRRTIDLMRESTSWRLTQPLRRLKQLFRWMAFQVKLLQEHGLLARLKALVRKLAKRTVGWGVAYTKARPALRMRLINLANNTGVTKHLLRQFNRLQAFTTDESLPLHQQVVSSYPIWSAHFDTPSAEIIHRLEVSTHPDSLAFVIARFDETSEQYAEELAARLVGSVGQRWQAVFVFSSKCNPATTIQGVRRATHADARISFDHPQVETDAEFVVLIEGGALPRPHALRVFADALRGDPDALVAYSDEDQFNSAAFASNPWFKPQFSPLLVSQGVLLGRMLAFRPETLRAQSLLGQLATADTEPAAFARNYALDAGEARVMHIPHVLFHDALAVRPPLPISWSLPELLPVVSIVIPTRDRWDLLGPCLESLKRTDWPAERLEIIVVDNGSTEPMTVKRLAEAGETNLIRVIRDNLQFNWSRLNNVGVRESRGELLVFLNNDTEVLDRAWLKKLAVHALRPGIGAVGCKLLFPDRTVQHGGVIAGIQGVAGHAHLLLRANEGGYRNLANITHEVSAVTGACLAVTHDNFEATGGFNESFRTAFNDVIFCFDLHLLGKRNVYVADPLLIHHESKSRGYDDTPEKLARNRSEARKAWTLHPQLMHNDPFYSPNLSLMAPYELSAAPRRRAFWDDPSMRPPRVMMLSVTHSIGHGVAVVMALQAEALVQHGYEVIVAGPRGVNDFPYLGCDRLEVHDHLSAATLAASRSVDLIIAETPPFFSAARWTGAHPPVLAIDHGEPPPDWFSDAESRRSILQEKDQALMMAHTVFAISNAVAAESRTPVHGILQNGNSHLGQWNGATNLRRQRVRMERGWNEQFVILNVCRFHSGERLYKGVDTYADVLGALQTVDPELSRRVLFILCGKGSPEDVTAMTERGLVVAANVTDEEMVDLYSAADAYANFSKWEGYNLGIGQALAMGLPAIASDIPAHRAFGIEVTNQPDVAAKWLVQIAAQSSIRTPRIWNWDVSLSQLIDEVDSICGRPHN